MAERRMQRQNMGGSSWRLRPLGVVLALVGLGLWAVQVNPGLVVDLGLMAVVPAVVTAIILYRRSLPHRARKALIGLGAIDANGQGPRLRRIWRRGSVWHLAWKMPIGVTVTKLIDRREAFEQALDASCDFWYDRGLVHMRAGVDRLPRFVRYQDFYRQRPPKGELVFGVGASREGPLWADLVEVLHLLVGAQTKWGKSVFLRQLLTRLVMTHGSAILQLALIDLKGGLEFNTFERLPHMLRPVARDLDSCLALLQLVLGEMARRQALLDAAHIENIQRWNRERAGQRLPYVLVVIDEYAELTAVEASDSAARQKAQDVRRAVATLTRLARALGIHIIVCTQRPDAQVVDGQIKANIPATVAFRVRGKVNSEILLGERNAAAATLPVDVKGRGIWQWDRETMFQGVFIDKAEAEAMLALAYDLPIVGVEVGTASVTPCPTCPDEPAGEVA